MRLGGTADILEMQDENENVLDRLKTYSKKKCR